MSRRRTSPAEDVAELVSLMPWWIGVVLALASYVLFHWAANRPLASPVPGQLAQSVLPSLWKGLASALQYIAPLLCLFGAAMSWRRRRERRSLVRDSAANRTPEGLQHLTWREFEKLVGEVFRMQGYEVAETGAVGGDGGVDLVLRKDRETYLVQCKKWKAYKVGVETVRELHGVMAARGATGGFVVTSGRFTREAMQFANGLNIRLIDGAELYARITKVANPAEPQAPSAAPVPEEVPPGCPLCRSRMVRRTAKKGARAGQAFWGCTGYPQCRGTRPI